MDVLALVPVTTKGWREYDQAQVNAAFAQHQDMAPHTLADCLHELEFWDALYHLRNGIRRDFPLPDTALQCQDWRVGSQSATLAQVGEVP